MIWINDPKTKRPSVTLTMFVLGFTAVTLKLLLSGINLGVFTLAAFSGSDYSMCIAALGGVYVIRKNKTIKADKEEPHA